MPWAETKEVWSLWILEVHVCCWRDLGSAFADNSCSLPATKDPQLRLVLATLQIWQDPQDGCSTSQHPHIASITKIKSEVAKLSA